MNYNEKDRFVLEFPTTMWHSTGDEENFFRWIYSILGYVTCQGQGRVLSVTFSFRKIDRSSLQELVAIFIRYRASDFEQLKIIEQQLAHGAWLSELLTAVRSVRDEPGCGSTPPYL